MLCSQNNNNVIRDDMNTAYRVVIKGVKDGFTEEQVTVKLAALFKTTEEQAKKILASGNFPVKKSIDLQTAAKYQEAVEATGASVIVEPEEEPKEVSPEIEKANIAPAEDAPRAKAVVPVAVATRFDEPPTTLPIDNGNGNTKHNVKPINFGNKISSVLAKAANRRIALGCAVAAAFVGVAALAKSPIEEYWKQHQQQEVIDRLSKLKPATFNSYAVETKVSADKVAVIDWEKLAPQSEMMKNGIRDLKAKDDGALKNYDFFVPYMEMHGADEEPSKEESDLLDDLDSLINSQPALTIELGEMSERIGQELTADGWFDFAYIWYQQGMRKGLSQALKHYEELAIKQKNYTRLIDLYSGNEFNQPNLTIRDYRKVAEYFALAASENSDTFLNKNAIRTILNNGPEVAASVWKALLSPAMMQPTNLTKNPLEECSLLSSDIADPANKGKGTFPTSQGGVSECAAAVKTNPDNPKLWYQFGYALQRSDEWDKARIAFARSAQLGDPLAIAKFWWIDAFVDTKRGISMLEAEAKAGNPWGDYFLGNLYYNGPNEVQDFTKAENHLTKADKSGIRISEVLLGEMFKAKGDTKSEIGWIMKAAEIFPKSRVKLGYAYLNGDGITKNIDLAREWLTKARDGGEKDIDPILSRIGKTKGEAIAGTWKCEDNFGSTKTSPATVMFSLDGQFQWNERGEDTATYGNYENKDEKLVLTPTKGKSNHIVVNLLQGRYGIEGKISQISNDSLKFETTWSMKGRSTLHNTSCSRVGGLSDEIKLSLATTGQSQEVTQLSNGGEADIVTNIRRYKEILDNSPNMTCRVFGSNLQIALNWAKTGVQESEIRSYANRLISNADSQGCL